MEAASIDVGKNKGELNHEIAKAKNAAFYNRFNDAKKKILDSSKDKFDAAQKAYSTQVDIQKKGIEYKNTLK